MLLVTVVTLAGLQVALAPRPPSVTSKIADYALVRVSTTLVVPGPLTNQQLTVTVASTAGPFFLVQLQLFYPQSMPINDLTLRMINIDNTVFSGVTNCLLIGFPGTYGDIVSTPSCGLEPYKVIELTGNPAIVASSSIAFNVLWSGSYPASGVNPLTAIATVSAPSVASVTITLEIPA